MKEVAKWHEEGMKEEGRKEVEGKVVTGLKESGNRRDRK